MNVTTTKIENTLCFVPNGEIDLDDALYPRDLDWSFDKPDVPYDTIYIFNREEGNTTSDCISLRISLHWEGIDLDSVLCHRRANMSWCENKPDAPHTTVYIFDKEEEEDEPIMNATTNQQKPSRFSNSDVDDMGIWCHECAECKGWFAPCEHDMDCYSDHMSNPDVKCDCKCPNGCDYTYLHDRATTIQALARGVLTRRKVHFALLSADPYALARIM